MDETTSREKILKKVRAALINKSKIDATDIDLDSNIYPEAEDSLELTFAQAFSELNGQFIFCENEDDFCENMAALAHENALENLFCIDSHIQELLRKAKVPFMHDEADRLKTNVGVTGCEFLIARTGSVMVSSKQSDGRRGNIFPNFHIVVAWTSQLVFTAKDALTAIKAKYGAQLPSLISTISGPSRTADIEKTLVQGAHGPKEIFVFLIDDQSAL